MVDLRLPLASDYGAFAHLFAALEVPDPVPDEDRFVTEMIPRVLLACEGADVVGYAFWQIYGRTAHVVHLVVDPLCRGRGVGQALLGAVRTAVVQSGCAGTGDQGADRGVGKPRNVPEFTVSARPNASGRCA